MELVAGLGATVRCGGNALEVADFVLGWTTLDFLGDAVSRAEAASE